MTRQPPVQLALDGLDVDDADLEKLSTDARRTARQQTRLRQGQHPFAPTRITSLTGATCGSCAFCQVQHHHDQTYRKCTRWGEPSRGAATDLRASWPGCEDWKSAKVQKLARLDRTVDPEWAALCDAAIARLAATGTPFTAYDLTVREHVPEPSSSAQWGARLGAARKQGLIRPIGFTESKRPETRSSSVKVWQGVGDGR